MYTPLATPSKVVSLSNTTFKNPLWSFLSPLPSTQWADLFMPIQDFSLLSLSLRCPGHVGCEGALVDDLLVVHCQQHRPLLVEKTSASVQLAETPTAIGNSFRYRTHHDFVTEAVAPCLGVKNPLAAATQNLGHLYDGHPSAARCCCIWPSRIELVRLPS